MLVLSRKPGQRILIGDDIVVSINRVSGNQVSIGLEAPDNVRILRAELHPLPQEPDTPLLDRLASAG